MGGLIPLIWIAIAIARAIGRASESDRGHGNRDPNDPRWVRPPQGGGPSAAGAVIGGTLGMLMAARRRLLPAGRLLRIATWVLAFSVGSGIATSPGPVSGWSVALLAVLLTYNLPILSAPVVAALAPPRPAMSILWVLRPGWAQSAPGAGAALVLLRARKGRHAVEPAAREAIAAALRELSPPGAPAPLTLVAWAALALASGDRARGLALMESVAALPPALAPGRARAMAMDWLQADAAERGDWERVAWLGLATPIGIPMDFPPGVEVASLVVLAHLGPPNGRALRRLARRRPALAWRLGPWLARLQSARGEVDIAAGAFDDLRRARWLAWYEDLPDWAGGPELPEAPPADPVPCEDPLVRAMALHRDLLARPLPTADEVERVARAWDEALAAPALAESLGMRAAALRATISAADALVSFRGEVESDLAAIVTVARLSPSRSGPTLEAVMGRVLVRERRAVMDRIHDLERLSQKKETINPMDLWVHWHGLRTHLEWILRGSTPSERRQTIHATFLAILNLGAWLHNAEGLRVLSRVLMLWLLELSEGVCTPEFVAIVRKNTLLRI